MTISTTDRLVIYQGNGATTIFPFNFIIPDQSVLTVQLQNHTSGELIEVLTPGDYIVAGFNNPIGGTVTYNPGGGPIDSTVDIAIIRTMPYTQDLEIDNQGGFYPEALTEQLDFIVMQIQQLAEEQSRSLIVNPGQEPPNIQDINDAVATAVQAASAADASADAAAASEANAAASEASVANVVAYLNTSEYNFSTSTTFPPASGEVRLNGTQAGATLVYLSHINMRGVDLTHLVPLIVSAGSQLLIQDRDQPGKYVIYNVIADPVLSGGDFQIGVSLKENGSALTAEASFVGFSGGGGSAVITTDDNPPAPPLRDGQMWFQSSTGRLYVYYADANSSQWVQQGAAPQITAPNTRNRGFIDPGFNLANDTTDATNDIVFPSGVVASDVAPYPLMQHTATIRQLDVNFDVNNTDRLGGRFSSAAISDGTWHCFIISNGTLVKSGFSKNLNPTADDLYPAGYTHYRRVASWDRVAGVLRPMRQRGKKFLYTAPVTDRNSTSAAASALLTLSVPTGIEVVPHFYMENGVGVNSNIQWNVGSAFVGSANMELQQLVSSANYNATAVGPELFTNTSAQIYFSCIANTGTVSGSLLQTYGFTDVNL